MLSDDLMTLFQNAALVTPGVDAFVGARAKLPDSGDGPFTVLVETPGMAPNYAHTQPQPWRNWLSVQVSVRAQDYEVALALAQKLFALVTTPVNRTINGVFYLAIRPRQSCPFDMGLDPARNFPKIGFNVLGQARG